MDSRISLVIATRNRKSSLGRTLERSLALPGPPPVVVVDNASSDGTVEFVRERYPPARLIALTRNLGAAARTVGVRSCRTPYVAFCDDDSWWEPAALPRLADAFDAHPGLGLIAARVLVGPEMTLDPTCVAMASSPLPACGGLPGPSILGFLACGAAVRRAAFLDIGGFEGRYCLGGEEELLAIDLAAAGWGLVYFDGAIAYHHPDVSGPRPGRGRVQARNALWTVWLRHSLPSVIRSTARAIRTGMTDAETRLALFDALIGLPWILRNRRVVPPLVRSGLRQLGR